MTVRLDDSDASLGLAASALAEGKLVAFPTETVYGLGARADDDAAVRAIFSAKGRPETKPLIVHVRDVAQARGFVAHWPDEAARLAEAFWPGPLTLVLPKAAHVLESVAAGGSSVAVRAPSHPVAMRLLALCPFAIAAPSANLSGEPPARSADEVLLGLDGRLAYVVDGGVTGAASPSTIVDLTAPRGPARVLREGAVRRDELARFIRLAMVGLAFALAPSMVTSSAWAWPPPEKRALPLRLDEAPGLALLEPSRRPEGRPDTFYATYRHGDYGRWRFRLLSTLDWAENTGVSSQMPSEDAWLSRQLDEPRGFPLLGDERHWFVRSAREEALRVDDALVPPWLRRLEPSWAESVLRLTGCRVGGCTLGASFPSFAFESLWTALAPLAYPIPAWQCRERATIVRRLGQEQREILLVRCDGSLADDALAELSILARPVDAAAVSKLPDEPAPHTERGEWVPGVRLLEPRLVWVLSQLSRRFHARPVYLYSGYRPAIRGSARGHQSLHASGRALDIAIEGVTNEDLLAACWALSDTGCGYYPNSKFVHIDVRPRSTGSAVWVDDSAPGHPSRYVDAWPAVVEGGKVVWPLSPRYPSIAK
ncbi:MAG: threonylcarbamoyl-AMP synthase [Myxococcales bacterium]|nr:threonylcarbamoyl-AMP synthase [Myxococcales bacterium]